MTLLPSTPEETLASTYISNHYSFISGLNYSSVGIIVIPVSVSLEFNARFTVTSVFGALSVQILTGRLLKPAMTC